MDKYLIADTQHHFNARASNWGFDKFVSFAELHDPDRGYVHKTNCVIEAVVLVKEFGYVGLEDQGYMSYLNSAIQTLYHIPCFRKVSWWYSLCKLFNSQALYSGINNLFLQAVCNMPTAENDLPSGSISLALQCLFYQMQHSGDNFIKTKNLTKSFGWEKHDSPVLHDVQEFNRVLCENLKNKMKVQIFSRLAVIFFWTKVSLNMLCISVFLFLQYYWSILIFCWIRVPLRKAPFNSCLKAALGPILNALMWAIIQLRKNHFMV